MLRQIFSVMAQARGPRRGTLPSRIRYATFLVKDPEAAEALYRWSMEWNKTSGTISDYVNNHFGGRHLRFHNPFYRLGEDGRLHSVLYNGRTPRGWARIPKTNWFKPEEKQEVRRVGDLPQTPARKDLHDLIGWPTFDQRTLPPDEAHAAWHVNYMVKAHGDGVNTYIDVPVPDNFTGLPEIYQAVRDWVRPGWLELTTALPTPVPAPVKH